MKRLCWTLFLLLIGSVLAGCARSDFNVPANEETLKQALIDSHLQVCAEQLLEWRTVPGFVSGAFLTVGADCAQPGVNIAVARFDSVEARDGAMNNVLNTNRVPGSHIVRTLGPLLITVEGARNDEIVQKITAALNTIGAR